MYLVVSDSLCPMSPPGFSVHGILGKEYWSGLPYITPGNLQNPGIEPESLVSLALAGGFFTTRVYQRVFQFFVVVVACAFVIIAKNHCQIQFHEDLL